MSKKAVEKYPTDVSVIIPVYNTEDYLPSCVESLLGQTFRDIEIILVNDGSTDGSGEACDRFALRDDRVKVIHKSNGGVSEARNHGLDFATGKYILFVDSDDWFAERMIEKLMLSVEHSDMAIDGLTVAPARNVPDVWKDITGYKSVHSHALLQKMLYQKGVHNGVAGKMYSSSLIGAKRFNRDITIGEDFLFNYEILSSESTRISILSSGDYFYFQRQGSAMNSKFDVSKMDAIKVSEYILNDISITEKSLRKAAERRMFIALIRTILLFQDAALRAQFKNEWDYLSRYAIKLAPIVIFDIRASFLDRLYGLLVVFTSTSVLVSVVNFKRRFRHG